MYPQYPEPPIKFKAFREAMGKAINRQEINSVVNFNEADIQLHPIWFLANHPWHPDGIRTYTDDPTGDIVAARQVLEDAGWSWDDDGNLLYPVDADTSPVWPAEETPNPDDFPCVDEEGNYVPRE
jgi:peptide/nickel transport system substrate-binding protein